MYENIKKTFYWPRLKNDVHEFIQSCDSCQRNKLNTQKPAGLLQLLPIPNEWWESISMDFILGLPKTKRNNDGIAVFIDRLSKQAHLEPISSEITAIQTADLFFRTVFRHHGIPKEIISNRDSKFTSNVWQALFKQLGTQIKLSTSFHPRQMAKLRD